MHQGFADLSLTTWVWHHEFRTVDHNRIFNDNQEEIVENYLSLAKEGDFS